MDTLTRYASSGTSPRTRSKSPPHPPSRPSPLSTRSPPASSPPSTCSSDHHLPQRTLTSKFKRISFVTCFSYRFALFFSGSSLFDSSLFFPTTSTLSFLYSFSRRHKTTLLPRNRLQLAQTLVPLLLRALAMLIRQTVHDAQRIQRARRHLLLLTPPHPFALLSD